VHLYLPMSRSIHENKLKQRLTCLCLEQVVKTISSAEQLLRNIIESKLSDTKSSAGDKFETSRERLQAEEDRINAVLMNSKKLEVQLKRLNKSPCNKVEAGAIIITDKANYFIAIGLGKISIDNTNYYTMSPNAPLSKVMWNKQSGDSFVLNNNTQRIIEIQ